MEINELLSFAQNGYLLGILATLLILSYLLYALFSWSFVKPCKYIGICSIIVGILLLIIKFGNSFVIDAVLSDITIPSSLLGTVFKPFLIMGIIYILLGIALLVVQNFYYKKKSKKNHR